MADNITGSFTGTGTSSLLKVKSGILQIYGTFVGTVQIEVDPLETGNWAPALDSSGAVLGLTVPGAMKIDNGKAVPMRLKCSAYTSGTINYVFAY